MDVVTKGPVAIAGSVLSFFKSRGIEAPTIVAVIIINNREPERTSAKLKDSSSLGKEE